MRDWMRRGDFWSGLALAALGACIVGEARRWVYLGEEGPGPGFFPLWYGGAMIVLSLLLVAGTVLKNRAGAGGSQSPWRDLARALSCWAAFVACIALMPVLGFAVSFALLTWFIVAVMARQRQRTALILAVAFSAGFYALFVLALDLSLPRGMLF